MEVNESGTNCAYFIDTLQRELDMLEGGEWLSFTIGIRDPSRMEVRKMQGRETLKIWRVNEIGLDSVASLIQIFEDDENCEINFGILTEEA